MSKQTESADYTKDSIKVINDFLIDLIGALIPGIIFLFSVTLCVVIPVIIIYINGNTSYSVTVGGTSDIATLISLNGIATKQDLLISNVFQGWFWLVIFFVFLILAYAIGNIFYRLDIKDVDRKSFKCVKKKHFKKTVLPLFKSELDAIKKEKADKNKETKEERKLKKAELFDEYYDLLFDHILSQERRPKKDRAEKDEIKEVYKNIIVKKSENEKNEEIELLNRIAYELYKNSGKNFLENEKLNLEDTNAVDEDMQFKILETFSKEYKSCVEKYGKQSAGKNTFLLALGWYFLFSLRSESACDNEEDCQFPYVFYNTYLIKRNEDHLLDYVEWYEKNSRSKNAINKLKLKIQLVAQREYNILVKNEAHIRMASSSWAVSITNGYIGGVSFIFLLAFTIVDTHSFMNHDICNFLNTVLSDKAYILIILLLPVLVLLLNLFIRKSVIEFLHYQRLREIFFVLQVYDEFFGINGVSRLKRWT
ncbi:hypothetical protein [Viscerimonas tarda]